MDKHKRSKIDNRLERNSARITPETQKKLDKAELLYVKHKGNMRAVEREMNLPYKLATQWRSKYQHFQDKLFAIDMLLLEKSNSIIDSALDSDELSEKDKVTIALNLKKIIQNKELKMLDILSRDTNQNQNTDDDNNNEEDGNITITIQ